MTFDPFGDFDTCGYLRNTAGLHDPAAVKEYEHRAFLSNLDRAFADLGRGDNLTYRDVLNTHKTLFGSVYPWAGRDRLQTAPDIAVSKGDVLFAHPQDAQPAVEHALRLGQVPEVMRSKPGEVMGYLAYGHPFLDGNGRTIMVVHSELAERSGISINWAATDKGGYLTALTRELERPGKGHLDAYLAPHVGGALGKGRLIGHLSGMQSLAGNPAPSVEATDMAGSFSDPAVQARYQHQLERRQQPENAVDDSSRTHSPDSGRSDGRRGRGRGGR